jgi:hypothetical protein
VTATGLSTLLVGGLLLAAVTSASASGQSISVSPHARLTAAKMVLVTGSGFLNDANGAILECNIAPGEPATVVSIHGVTHAIPVGCTNPVPAKTTRMGKLASRLPVVVGTLGSWESGSDSTGGPSAADSASYPCPPTSSQESLGVSCAFEFLDNKGQVATRSVTFNPASTTTTTTTTTMPLGCDPAMQSGTSGPATLTVNPGTCLTGGMVVSLSGSGFTPNNLGTILECNLAPDQPTVSTLGNPAPVGCSSLTGHLATTGPTGALPATPFTVATGTVGPPATGTDSAGNDAATDAAHYPCPPAPAQVSAGVTCGFEFSDAAGDTVVVPISFRG